MKIYKIATTIFFIRGENSDALTKATGEAGWGYYFSPVNNKNMVDYYTKDAKHVWIAYPKSNCKIEDLTSQKHIKGIVDLARKNSLRLKEQMGDTYVVPKINKDNYQRNPYAIEEYVKTFLPDADAYLILHSGHNIPSGKQLVITNLDAFNLEQTK